MKDWRYLTVNLLKSQSKIGLPWVRGVGEGGEHGYERD